MQIVRYAVTPLSPTSGLIEWIPHCDTMHAVIKAYREPRKIPIDLEHKMMLSFCPDLESVPLLNKAEALDAVLSGELCVCMYVCMYVCQKRLIDLEHKMMLSFCQCFLF